MQNIKIEKAYAKEAKDLLQILATDMNKGLSEPEAKKRLEEFGKNKIQKKKERTSLEIIIAQLSNPLVVILIFAFAMSYLLFSKVDAAIVLAAIVLNVFIGYMQEKKASGIFKKLESKIEKTLSVLRDGKEQSIVAEDLVPGDIVFIEAGKSIPADLYILESQNLKVDESALTGESVAVDKEVTVLDEETPLHKRKNILFAGTLVLDGLAKALVIRTADNTELGKIADDVDVSYESNTPIQKKMAKLSQIIAISIASISIALVLLAIYRGYEIKEAVFLVIALAVAAVPEGLPAAISVALAVGMERILKKGGLVKYPAAAESLGSVDYILTDKTGTLTSGKMSLSQLRSYGSSFENENQNLSQDQLSILRAATLASDAYFELKDGKLVAHGRPIEKAIILKAQEKGLNQKEMFENGFERLDFIPFSSARRFAVSLNRDKDFGTRAYLSGAPETLLALSKYLFFNGETVLFDEEKKKEFNDLQSRLSSEGKRLTAVAMTNVASLDDFKKGSYEDLKITFLGFLVFEDAVRESVPPAIDAAHKMGLKVLMLTGDNKETAIAIAKKSNILNENDSNESAILGIDFEKLSDKEVLRRVEKKNGLRVFARMLPRHKKRMMSILQNAGYSVAMTGDGINDAPALSVANIGIAVESGTDVAKAAADMILLKGSFASISFAIKEGRRVLSNIYKIIVYMLSTSFGEMVLISVALIFGGPLPLLPSQLLWHNIVEGGLMNFPFAFDKETKNTGRLAKDKDEFEKKHFIFAAYLAVIFSSLLLLAYLYMLQHSASIESIRTVMFVTLSTSGFFLALSLRNVFKPFWRSKPFSNTYLNIALAVNIFLLLLTFLIEPLRNILGLVVPGVFEIEIIVVIALLKWLGIELTKYFIFARKA